MKMHGLLAVGMVICFAISLDKIYSFYESHMPPYKVGECFEVFDISVGTIKFEVLKNNILDQYSETVAEIKDYQGSGNSVFAPYKLNFEEIKLINPLKVECK